MYSVRAPRRRRRAGFRIFLSLLVVLLVVSVCFNALRPLPDAQAATEGTTSKISAVTLKWPSSGSSALGAKGFGVLDAYGAVSPRPIASLTQLVTALALIEQKPFNLGEQGETYTFTQRDVDLYNSYRSQGVAVVKVSVGEQISEYQILQAMLLPSANNIADTAALWAFGSKEAFLAYTQGMGKRLGLKQLSLADASGLSSTNVATTRELVLLGERVMAQPVLANIVGQQSATIPVAGTVRNTNPLLGTANIVGIKTGLTDDAGGCLLFAANHKLATGENVMLIGVIIGAKTLEGAIQETVPLIDSAKLYFSVKNVVTRGQKVATYQAPWGSTVDAIAAQDVDLVIWQGAPLRPEIKLHQPARVRNLGDEVGTYTVRSGLNGRSTPIVLKNNLPGPSVWWRLTRLD
jgi:serine-type D-Ala-D-Ala carboxypeptidase (penicillin-binding protein 5/6)